MLCSRGKSSSPMGASFAKQKTAYEISACLVGSEMCIRDRSFPTHRDVDVEANG